MLPFHLFYTESPSLLREGRGGFKKTLKTPLVECNQNRYKKRGGVPPTKSPPYQFILTYILCILFSTTNSLFAQTDSSQTYPPINENALLHTKWKYTYTTHQASNTIIHKADKDYQYYLYLRYDYVYEMYLNGKFTQGEWQLNLDKNKLYYPFRNINWWHIAAFDDTKLVLEYYAFGRIAYRYHFVPLDDKTSPFLKPANELPDVLVDNYRTGSNRTSYRYTKAEKGKRRLLKKKRSEEKLAAIKNISIIPDQKFIQIELVGGGFYGGIDKVYKNNLIIKNNGQLVREIETELNGLRITRRNIPRAQLDSLIAFMEKSKFFDWPQVYNCENRACMERFNQSPRPIALRLAVTYGSKRKIVIVSLWDGKGRDQALIDYPRELDIIIQTLENMTL